MNVIPNKGVMVGEAKQKECSVVFAVASGGPEGIAVKLKVENCDSAANVPPAKVSDAPEDIAIAKNILTAMRQLSSAESAIVEEKLCHETLNKLNWLRETLLHFLKRIRRASYGLSYRSPEPDPEFNPAEYEELKGHVENRILQTHEGQTLD